MTADLNAHSNLMGGVRKATKAHKLSLSKKAKARLDTSHKKEDKKEPVNVKSERIEKDKLTSSKSPVRENTTNVSSTRVYPSGPKSLSAPAPPLPKPGPASITPPGPSAKSLASKKASAAKKGTKNTTSMKVATPLVDLESDAGGLVYNITDVPRQWKKNG